MLFGNATVRTGENHNAGDLLLLQNEISELDYLIDAAYQKGIKIMLNPSPFVPAFRDMDLNKFFCLIVNETEAASWADNPDPFAFIELIKEKAPSVRVVLTLGGDGAAYYCDGEVSRYPACETNVVDTTAAGDTFTGYWLAAFQAGCSQDEIFTRAATAAAIAISIKGASSSIPTKTQVDQKLQF